jgi:hypothetical protein
MREKVKLADRPENDTDALTLLAGSKMPKRRFATVLRGHRSQKQQKPAFRDGCAGDLKASHVEYRAAPITAEEKPSIFETGAQQPSASGNHISSLRPNAGRAPPPATPRAG